MTHPARLATLALAAVAATACAGNPAALEAPADDPSIGVLFTIEEGGTVTPTDSVQGGYGSGSTGGLEYTCFEYDPATQTEYVVTEDPDATSKGLTCTTTSDPEMTSPTPPPPPPPSPSRYVSTTPPPAPQDSVQSGYGSGSTGGLEYENFEYEPETGTEYEATPDTTGAGSGMTPTTTGPTPAKP